MEAGTQTEYSVFPLNDRRILCNLSINNVDFMEIPNPYSTEMLKTANWSFGMLHAFSKPIHTLTSQLLITSIEII